MMPLKKVAFSSHFTAFLMQWAYNSKALLDTVFESLPKNISFWKAIWNDTCAGKYNLLSAHGNNKNEMRLFWGSFQTVWIAFQDPLGFYSTFFIWAVTWKVPLLLLQLHQLEPFHLLMFLATVSLHSSRSSSFSSSHKGTFCIRF